MFLLHKSGSICSGGRIKIILMKPLRKISCHDMMTLRCTYFIVSDFILKLTLWDEMDNE